ncbi:Sensor histidine kinase TmoS [termite gut metagenome]|uniref:Sensor histidine kinase TmoS n=1 Tax=termite gut metagenome TaxID=433724 RepID=A0A5J4STL8_9ZZZZ
MKPQRLYPILLLLFVFLPAHAIPPLTVEHYTVDKGLPGNTVYCSLKDSDGFMWFGTLYGLCSFDGINFKVYNNHDGAFYSENPPRQILTIAEDKNEFLWMQTADRKAYVFDRKKERFHLLCSETEKHTESTKVIKIQKTPDGEILLLTADKKLLRACGTDEKPAEAQFLYDLTTLSITCNLLWVNDNAGTIYHIIPQTGKVDEYPLPGINDAIQTLLVGNDNETVYIYTGRGEMYEYNVKSDQLQRHLLNLSGPIADAFVDKYDKIWLKESDATLLYYDPQSKIEKRFPVSQGGRRVTDMQMQDAGEQGLFILTPAGEMLVFERESLSMTRLTQEASFPATLQPPLFFSQELNDDGLLWLSSSQGIYCVNFLPKQFRLFGLQTFKRAALYTEKEVLNPSIDVLFRAQNGDIWIGTQRNLYFIDKSGQLKEVLMPLPRPVISNVCHIMEDNKGNLWFSTKGEGVIKAIPNVQAPYGFHFVRYTNNPEVLSSLTGNNVRFTFQDSKDRIWVGLSDGGLNLLQETDKVSFKHKYNGFKQYPLSYSSYTEVRGMVESAGGRIWVATTDGLMSFEVNFDEPENIVFETYHDQTSASPICNDNIGMLYKDADSRIWVSLFGGGLSELTGYDGETQKLVFKSYGTHDGLKNDIILSIAEDDSRNLWLVTETGISCFDKQTERFHNYDKFDGFPGITTVGENPDLLSSKNEFWLGCKEGILAFSPDKLETRKYNCKTHILDFRVNGKENLPTDTPIKYAGEVEVEHDRSTFTIEFMALDYSNRGGISYEYILEGYEKEWHFNSNNRIASYTGVSPGKYKFRVRSIDEANSESFSDSTLTIHILPSWKSSWCAYALYIVIIIGILAIISKSVMMLIKARNEAYIKRRLSELKIKFFTYISHEMRIPLTLIKSPIQELKEEKNLSPKGRKYIGLMEKNTNQMLQLLNQILDFRKVQHDKIRLNISQINLNRMMESFYKEFRTLSEESEVAYSFQLTNEVITLWADKEKLSLVIRNIVSNAFKFTPSGQSITVSTGISDDGKKCYIKIEGDGIPENALPKILRDSPQDDHSWNPYSQGKGIGFTLSEELINLHHGSIIVESNEDHGIVFTIELLSDKKHYNFSEINFIDVEDDDNELERIFPPLQENRQQKQPKTKEDSLQSAEKNRIFKKKNAQGQEEHIGDFFEDTYPVVLLIEDNKDLADLFSWQLEGKYHVGIIANVEEGVKKINQYHPDIVIIDQILSKASSMEILKLIRKDFRISHIPVVILAVEEDNDDSRIKFLNMGVSAYITGPIEKEYLISQLEHLIKKRQQFRERVWNLADIEKLDSYKRYLTKRDVQLLEKLVRIIDKNLSNNNFNLDGIIPDTQLNRLAFFKKLKGLTGFAPIELIKEARLNKSAELLKTTDMSLPEIAFALGFKDLEDYEKCFFAKYNQTPTRYRNNVES